MNKCIELEILIRNINVEMGIMNEQFLYINDELLHKLEFFIYDHDQTGMMYNDVERVVNFSLSNKKDLSEAQDRNNIYRLRSLLSYHEKTFSQKMSEIENAIEIFLMFLRTKSIEASMCLENLLDAIWGIEEKGEMQSCIKRLNGILSSVFLVDFSDKAIVQKEDETQSSMKRVFEQNIKYYTVEDKNFLNRIFLKDNRFDCIISLIKANMVVEGKEEKCTPESENVIWIEFSLISNRLRVSKRYKDMLILVNQSEPMFRNLSNEIRGRWERQKAESLFYLGQYEEAIKILNKYVSEVENSVNVYDLYNNAINYAWAAEYKEKYDSEWYSYIHKAYSLITRAENIISQSRDKYSEYLQFEVILEKSFLLSEMEKYDEAYECFEMVFSGMNENVKKDSNFNTHLWILMKYMCLHPEKDKLVLDWIKYFYEHFSHTELGRYQAIVDFFYAYESILNNELGNEIYHDLLELSFHASEILHETKLRDISQFIFLYYTKAEHLKILLEDESEGNSFYRLPMFHARHMNDPQEGKILQNLLQTNDIFSSDKQNVYKENYVFLKSFFSYKKDDVKQVKEFLPMWVQYGDDAKGCCVILNQRTFEKNKLRRIVYLSDTGKCSEEKDKRVQQYLEKFINAYKRILSNVKKFNSGDMQEQECLTKISSLLEDIVFDISYLFKHESYKHEKEVRIIKNKTSCELNDVKVISGQVPKLYIYNDAQTYIDEVVLGSKMENPENYVPFIYKQGNKMWKDEKENHMKVTQSRIQYK